MLGCSVRSSYKKSKPSNDHYGSTSSSSHYFASPISNFISSKPFRQSLQKGLDSQFVFTILSSWKSNKHQCYEDNEDARSRFRSKLIEAFIVFEDIQDSTLALRALQGFPLFEKGMKISYAKQVSRIVKIKDRSLYTRTAEKSLGLEKRKVDDLQGHDAKRLKTDETVEEGIIYNLTCTDTTKTLYSALILTL